MPNLSLRAALLVVGASALAGSLAGCAADAPSTYRADSPANPDARPAPRHSVAAVLSAKEPSEARLCAEGKPCVFPEATQAPEPAGGADPHAGHLHHHH